MKKIIAMGFTLIMIVSMLFGCTKSQPPAASDNNAADTNKTTETVPKTEEKSKKAEKVEQNAKTDLALWTYQNSHETQLNERIAEYQAANPNVTITQSLIPSKNDEYWQKLAAAVAAKNGPDIAYFHNQRISTFKDALAPFPEDIFPLEEMREKYFAFDEACMIDGKWYFFPIGIMDGQIYYNKQIFEEEGITDIPVTWDEFLATAKQLTKYDGSGNVTRAGFTSKGFYRFIWPDFFFQADGQWYADDGKTVAWDSEAGRKATDMLAKIIQVERVDSSSMPGYEEAFVTGLAAMVHSRGFFGGTLDDQYPDFEYGVFPIPVENEDVAFLGRNNYECGFTVLAMSPDQEKTESFKFLKALYTPEWIQFECSFNNRIPSLLSLWTDEVRNSTPVLQISFEQAPRTVFLGDAPQATLMALEEMVDNLYNGMDQEQAFQIAIEQANEGLENTPAAWIVEKQWKESITSK